jgi:hypothetical protein
MAVGVEVDKWLAVSERKQRKAQSKARLGEKEGTEPRKRRQVQEKRVFKLPMDRC